MVLPVFILDINSRNASVLGGNELSFAPAQCRMCVCVTSSFHISEPQTVQFKRVHGIGGAYLRQVTVIRAVQQAFVWFTLCPMEAFKVNVFERIDILTSQCLLCPLCWLDRDASSDLTPTYQPPVLVNPSGESNLLKHLSADRGGQGNLGQICLHSNNSTTGGEGANVNHQNLILCQLLHLGTFLVTLSSHSKQTPEQVIGHLKLSEDGGKMANST